jgi:inorganic pyrophosphatase
MRTTPRRRLAATLAVAVLGAVAAGAQTWPRTSDAVRHPYDRAQPGAPEELWVVIEIPRGSAVKYELDKETGAVYVDRFQSMPVHAPVDYGSLPRTLAPDGDPMDALVLARHPIQSGAFVRVRPIGLLKTLDGKAADDKILTVPVSAVDPTYDAVRELADVPAAERERIAAYFRVYKQLPGGQEGKLLETGDAAAARAAVRAGLARYLDARR